MDYEFDIAFDLALGHNAQSSKDRSSLFDGGLVSRPDEKVGRQILDWLDREQQPAPAEAVVDAARTPMFNDSGNLTSEKESKAMLDAIRQATSLDRLESIEQSQLKGLRSQRLTEEQSQRIAEAITSIRRQILPASTPKAA